MSITYAGFDNTHSKWIDVIDRSNEQFNGMVVANVMYSDKRAKNRRVYDCFFWVSLEDYEALSNASSQGSHYWHNWSVYGTPKERYMGQDAGMDEDGTEQEETTGGVREGVLNNEEGEALGQNVIDGKVLKQAKKQQENGNLEEWLEDKYGDDQDSIETIRIWLERMEGASDLFERTQQMRALIQTGEMTTKQMMKTFMLDIQEMFGISLDKRFMFNQLSSITGGKLNPNQWVKYKYQLKQVYDVMDKEGIKGLGKVGQRIVGSKNPLVRDRTTYKAKETIRGAIRNNKRWLEGEDAEKAISQFHRKVLKENANGIKKANSMYLERKVLKNGTKVVRWRKDVKIGRKIIQIGKKALRIAKFFL